MKHFTNIEETDTIYPEEWLEIEYHNESKYRFDGVETDN